MLDGSLSFNKGVSFSKGSLQHSRSTTNEKKRYLVSFEKIPFYFMTRVMNHSIGEYGICKIITRIHSPICIHHSQSIYWTHNWINHITSGVREKPKIIEALVMNAAFGLR
ncbi:hypothetical protein O6H91_08G097800 [Diphasiastrum complanatum]|uniref:Uncharacterized protein n=1 Tax=Diphasiastrum complanatum TaxID=34168 RepID=A0ACC2D0P5_DIPCM|nr:hypothetical protein O6H91_08G097800 [Diphasiastrum complanatum]